MEYTWQVLPVDKKIFKNQSDYHQIILQLLYSRGFTSSNLVEKFLYPDYKRDVLDPFLFEDMTAAIDLIINHIKKKNKIVIYGDYDADGVTASALLVETFSVLHAKTDVYIPERVSEGYGLNKIAIDEIASSGVKLVITVDTGIRNKEEAEYLKEKGLDIIITDHHEPPESKKDLPQCLIVNPKAGSYPEKNLAGVGVAFKLAQALIKKAKLKNEQKKMLEERALDLVAIGTIADCVKLAGENRVLAKFGLEVINKKNRSGLKELINIAQGANIRKMNAWSVSWQIAPRLNAAGRLAHANTSFELLITKNRAEAKKIAGDLNRKNVDRQKITGDIIEFCQKEVDKKMVDDKMLVLLSPSINNKNKEKWPEGVVGLVAGKLTEQYNRPTLVITGQDDDIRGSGRSIDGFDITEALERHKEFLDKFGGHKGACGFSLKSKQDLHDFTAKIKEYTSKKLTNFKPEKKLKIDMELDSKLINDDLVEQLMLFEPHGEGNARPKFVSRNLTIMDKVEMGADSQHVKFRFNGFWALAFGQADNWKKFRIGDRVDIVYYLEFNEFNGNKKIQLKLVDIKTNK